MFANCQCFGVDFAFPDVCNTPIGPVPTPIPYPNFGPGPEGVPCCPNILIDGGPAHNLETEIPLTQGDDPGIELGDASGTVMASSRSLTGAVTVLFDGAPATRLSSVTLQNSTNMFGARILPSQATVLILAL
ncbi:MAG: DUF4150 domain-containing protein [Minicystis sp.]